MRGRFKLWVAGFAALAMVLAARAATARLMIASGMMAVRQMVDAGRMAAAVRVLESDYDFESPGGRRALGEFSLLVLRRGLKDADLFERCYAATALAAHDDWSGRAIIGQALTSPNLLIQKAAVEGLAEAQNREALQILEGFYRSSGPISRALALQALAEVKAPTVMPLLLEATHDPNSSGAFWAVNGLGRMGDRDALPGLRMLLAKSIDPMVRTETAHSMVLLGDRTSLDTLEVELGSNDAEVAAAAALALGDARDPGAVELLEVTLSNQRASAQARLAAAVALTHYGNREGMPMLQAALNDQNQRVAYLSSMLDHVDFKNGRDLILHAAQSRAQELRLTAYEIIGRSGGEAEIALLSAALESAREPMDRAQIVWSLARIGRPASIPILLEVIQDRASETRYTAADGLARIAGRMSN